MNELIERLKSISPNIVAIVFGFAIVSTGGILLLSSIQNQESVLPTDETEYVTLTFTDDLNVDHFIEAELATTPEKRAEG